MTMWRPKWLSRESGDSVPEPGTQDVPAQMQDNPDGTADVPPWVTEFRRWGVPAAAVLVLVLCAPGERYLALLVGWNAWMSWGMAGLFTLYAGLAAVISTQLPKGARGKVSSIFGAVISLALAMGAQPVAHLFVTGYLHAEPRPPLWLIGSVSSIPPLILGHLLHFAAMQSKPVPRSVPESVPVSRPRRGTSTGQTPAAVSPPRPPASPASPARTSPEPTVSLSRVSPAAVPASGPAVPQVSASVPVSRPALSAGTSRPSMGARALSLLEDGTSEDEVARTLRDEFVSPDGTPPKTNTVRKSINRAKDKLSRP